MPQREKPNQSQTVPPPDAHQIASSNETLNTFLGGRTRSWMTGGSSAVTNPRPAPVAPSNSRKRNKKRKASDTAPPTQNDNDIERDNIPTDQSSEQPTGARETARASTVLPSPALTDVPSPNGSNQVDCTNLDSSVHAKSVGPGRPVSKSNMNQGDSIHVATNTHQPNPVVASSTQARHSIPQHARIAEAATLATVTNPATTGQARQTGDVPSRVNSTQHNSSTGSPIVHSRPSSTSEHRAKRPRVQEESRPECQEWLNQVQSRKAESNQARELNEVEGPRYDILSEACRNDEYFYIAFHQTLCAWSLNREPVHRLYRDSAEPAVIDVAFEIMQTILRKNEYMSKSHLQWFANFPHGMAAFSRVFPRTTLSREISTFLVLMTTHWGMLLRNVQTRKYPLLVHELSYILRCRSRKLRSMLFTKSRRTIYSDEGPAAKAINKLFDQDEHNERVYETRGDAPEVVKSAREAMAKNYRQLVLSQQQVPANTIRSPVVGQTPYRAGQNAQQVVRPPLAASVSSSATNPTTPPLSLPHFDALAARVPTGGFGAASPTSVNEAYQHSSRGFQSARRQNQLHIQTANPEARPLSAPVNQSPFEQQLLRRPSGAGSPLASQNRALPSNGQIRTPVLPSNNVLSQGRASSFTLPPQGLAAAHEANASNSPVHVYSAGMPQVRSPAQMMYPHYAQAMQSPQYPPVYAQPNPPGHASALQSHSYAAQPTVPRTPTFQGPVASNEIRQRPPVQQIPLSDYPRGPYGNDSLQVGLHQVEVRSPRRVPSHPGKGRFYQFVRSLVYEPTALEPQTGLRTLSFTVPERHIQGLSKKIEGNGLPFCYYSEGSYRYRLRICSQPETQATPTESDWVVAATSWPGHISIDLNMQHLELRRKQHFNKDQPVELTDHLHEGENVLKISFPAVDQNTIRGYKYFMAIEIVQTISHGAVLNLVQSLRHMSKDETEAKIQRRLQPSDSDDIIIEDETLTISLADPFSATRFSEPVRGSQCEHLECFDLETWLQTRPPKPPQNGGGPQQQGSEPSMVDVWKCPICSLDARPTSLWVDDYLAGVRQSLLSGGDMRTKSITVASDGKWAPVLDVDDSDDESTPVLQHRNVVNGNAGRQSRTSSMAAAATVIEILDDD